MNAPHMIDGDEIDVADSWAVSVTDQIERSRRTAWIVASVSAAIALLLAIALVLLLPLKTVQPYTLLVDRQTGNVEALAPLEEQIVTADAALTRSFLVQYVIARESYDIDSLQTDYRKVALWSEGRERQRYLALMNASTPGSPLATLPRQAVIRTEVKSVSSLSDNSSLVRFQTTRADPGARPQAPQHWAAIINFTYSGAAMSEEDRLLNPLGFQVTRYRRDAETIAEPGPSGEENARPAPNAEAPTGAAR